jgi:hypothetical protein
MKKEFHYYITHLIAARAGFRGDDLRILAHASQLTDDNDTVYKVKDGRKIAYINRISQTLQPIKRRAARLEVYPLFHFIPGDPNADSAKRMDGKINPFNTTPNSANANRIIDAALGTGNFYQIGIATHAYVDTWAHQNFVGYKDRFNKFSGFFDPIIPNIGHADAKTKPDQPRLAWNDERLANSAVNNKERFLEAAGCLFGKLRNAADPKCSKKALDADCSCLITDLDAAMGGNYLEVDPCKKRQAGYSELAITDAYGKTEIHEYKPDQWFKSAVKTGSRHIGSPSKGNHRQVDTFDIKPGFETSDWFKFQEAVKSYADRTKSILCETVKIAAEYGA